MVDLNQIKIAFFDLKDESVHGFIDQCQDLSIDLCLVSLNNTTANVSTALALAQKTYGVDFEVCSAPSIELTFTVMETMVKLRGYAVTEALLVSTNAEAVSLAEQKGFLVLNDLTSDFAVTQENRCKIGYTDSIADLVIPEIFYDEEDRVWYRVIAIEEKAFNQCTNLESVLIPDSVTEIGAQAFDGCTNLTSVNIGSSVESIGNSAFSGCAKLESIVMPESVTSIKMGAFTACRNLKSVVFPSSITKIEPYTFWGCGFTSLEIPNTVTSIGTWAFGNCCNLKSVVLPDSITTIDSNVFNYCTGLTDITIPNSVTSIGDYAFYCCENLTLVTIPDSVTLIDNCAFTYCTKLTELRIPSSVIEIGENAFYYVPKVIYNGPATGAPWGAKSVVTE